MIEADQLRAQVRSAAPFLFAGDAPAAPGDALAAAMDPRGWHALVRSESAVDADGYFALCCAAHHGTVASYVPTDVDSKIRGTLWKGLAPEQLRRRAEFALAARRWSIAGVSARAVVVDGAPVSGHDGEWLAVLMAALGALRLGGEAELAARVEVAIDEELAREARALTATLRARGAELDALRLAAILTHNVGDVDQGLSYWPDDPALAAPRARFARLAHENRAPYQGSFQTAARIYRATLAPEGHRNYPLRAVKPLRAESDLLLPLAPFLDDWGGTVASHPSLRTDARAEVAGALIDGCRKVPGQSGYYRALAGMIERLGSLDQLARHLPGAQRKALEAAETRRHLAVTRLSFEASLRKRLTAASSAC
jgi:hypothetical protein